MCTGACGTLSSGGSTHSSGLSTRRTRTRSGDISSSLLCCIACGRRQRMSPGTATKCIHIAYGAKDKECHQAPPQSAYTLPMVQKTKNVTMHRHKVHTHCLWCKRQRMSPCTATKCIHIAYGAKDKECHHAPPQSAYTLPMVQKTKNVTSTTTKALPMVQKTKNVTRHHHKVHTHCLWFKRQRISPGTTTKYINIAWAAGQRMSPCTATKCIHIAYGAKDKEYHQAPPQSTLPEQRDKECHHAPPQSAYTKCTTTKCTTTKYIHCLWCKRQRMSPGTTKQCIPAYGAKDKECHHAPPQSAYTLPMVTKNVTRHHHKVHTHCLWCKRQRISPGTTTKYINTEQQDKECHHAPPQMVSEFYPSWSELQILLSCLPWAP